MRNVITKSTNGVTEPEPVPEAPWEPRLHAGSLKRLARLQARLEGATLVAQAAVDSHLKERQLYQQAFEVACEDAGIAVPEFEAEVNIDWTSGQVRFTPK